MRIHWMRMLGDVGDRTSATSPSHHEQCYQVLPQPRARRRKRPFSPEPIANDRKAPIKARTKKKDSIQQPKDFQIKESKAFSCDKCGSSSVVNPSRCRLNPNQIKRVQTVRRKVDPVTNKVLNLCNACGLAFSRPPKKFKGEPNSHVDRKRYLAEAEAFAKDVSERVGKRAAERLYCPSFKNKPCSCIQTYLSHTGDEGSTLEIRVDSLLQLFNTACDLNRRKNLFPEYSISDSKTIDDANTNSVERKQRQRDYEQFILETRQSLREKLHLCERACQRILLYSNNFLHKRLKSIPDQCSRISRYSSTSQLKPIDELGSIPCCSESCSRLAITHSTLLEEWRNQSALGQRQARRVLAEMLTPSGGTKANCYKFISMVTGCGSTTISSVSHQMRVTKGNREPPEHGLKKWYRENPRKQSNVSETQVCKQDQSQHQGELALSSNLAGQTKTASQNQGDDPNILIEQQRRELEEAKRQLYLKQQQLDRCQQIIDHHLGQQVLVSADKSENNPLWKGSGAELITVPVDANESIMSGLSNTQSVQLIDLMPGTYIAVPSGFDSSTFLTVASDKQIAPSSDVLPSDDLQIQQQVVYSSSSHPLPPPNNDGNTLIHSESGAIYTITSAADMVGSIIEEVQPLENGYSEILVAPPTSCDGVKFSYVDGNKQCGSPVIDGGEARSIVCNNSSILPMKEDSLIPHPDIPSSFPTSVIMPPNNNHSQRSASNETGAECSSMLKCVRDVPDFDLSTSLNSVILVPDPEQAQPSSICMNAFEQLFE